MPNQLHIKTFCLGDWATNCYVVRTDSGQCWLVDVGFGPDSMIQYVKDEGLEPQQVVLTHAHVDHIAGLSEVRSHWPQIPILIHAAEQRFLTEPLLNLSIALDQPIVAPEATGKLDHGQTLDLDGFPFEVRHTPGHSPGGVSLVQHDHQVVIAGDCLFAGSVGRTDFPTSDPATLIDSIRTQLYTLPDETSVLPGHGPATTIGAEKKNNPFVR